MRKLKGARDMSSILKLKRTLNSQINALDCEKSVFVVNPERDFTRNRKLSFKKITEMLLCMGKGSLPIEINKYMNYKKNTPSVSAFVQQRAKILPEAFETLFRHFTNEIYTQKSKYRLLAIDGSDVLTAPDPDEKTAHFPVVNNQKAYNLYHLNAIMDLENNIYVDVVLQNRRQANEFKALAELVDRSSIERAILIADRGYESYNNIAHIQEKGWKFLIRAKEKNGIIQGLDLPKTDEFDVFIELNLMKGRLTKHRELLQNKNNFKALNSTTVFDFFDDDRSKFYKVSFRVVRLEISDGNYEVLLTNLDKTEFSAQKLKELYAKRWGIETSFRSLKYSVGLLNFHAKKADFVKQEIFCALIMYNFAQAIKNVLEYKFSVIKSEKSLNFTLLYHASRDFFLQKITSKALINATKITKVRQRTSTHRTSSLRKLKSFNYRIV